MAKSSKESRTFFPEKVQNFMEKLTLKTPTYEAPPLITNYNDRIRPLLDAIDKLRHLQVMKEGIQLPTIVVVGDQSSGKSSVLESLAGISLPRGQGICTRVPLIMRLQHHSEPSSEFFLEFHGKTIPTDETHISEAISNVTDQIAGKGKGISNSPLTLVVKKQGVPDLTMVDLPGITRVPVHGQPENIYEQISSIIKEYISPKESIILNVLSATVDFPTCESIRMSQNVDKTGERTLAVVTKVDKAPEGLLEKVTDDDVNIGLGYVCVRNRIGDESYEHARMEEAKLFESHPLLSRLDKSIVGVHVLAQRLVQIQATSIGCCLPDIEKTINEKLNQNVAELNKLPPNLSSYADAMTAFMRIIGLTKESLKKILVRGEFDEYPDDPDMHCTARMAEMLTEYCKELHLKSDMRCKDKFLLEEIQVLEETKAIWLPNFLPRTAFLTILQRKVKDISCSPIDFVHKVWNYIEFVVLHVVTSYSEGYPQLQNSTRRAAQNLILKMKEKSVDRVREIVEMEKLADYTCDPEYMNTWNALMTQKINLMNLLASHEYIPGGYTSSSPFQDTPRPERIDPVCASISSAFQDIPRHAYVVDPVCTSNSASQDIEPIISAMKVNIPGYGEVEIGDLGENTPVEQAFDLNMRLTAYWKIVLKRLVDSLGLHILFSVQNLINKDMEMEIVNELMEPNSGGIERLFEESPTVATKRSKLNNSIKLLKESKEVVSKIMDRIACHGTHSAD